MGFKHLPFKLCSNRHLRNQIFIYFLTVGASELMTLIFSWNTHSNSNPPQRMCGSHFYFGSNIATQTLAKKKKHFLWRKPIACPCIIKINKLSLSLRLVYACTTQTLLYKLWLVVCHNHMNPLFFLHHSQSTIYDSSVCKNVW